MNARIALLVGIMLVSLTGCDIFNQLSGGSDLPEAPRAPAGPPDLAITISGPAEVHASEDIAPLLQIEIANRGGGLVRGTRDPEGNLQEGGYMIDFVMSSDQNVPPGFAIFSEEYFEDVLLRGGRMSNTPNLTGGSSLTLADETTSIPDSIPLGDYYICAQIDSGEVVVESNEANNVSCFATRVVGSF